MRFLSSYITKYMYTLQNQLRNIRNGIAYIARNRTRNRARHRMRD